MLPAIQILRALGCFLLYFPRFHAIPSARRIHHACPDASQNDFHHPCLLN